MGKYYIQAGKTYFEFNNGEKVIIKPVSPALVISLQTKFVEPQPPINQVTNDEGITFDEEDFNDVSYKRKHDQWTRDINNRWTDVLIRLGAKPIKIDQALLDEIRLAMQVSGAPLPDLVNPGDLEFQYVKYCLLTEKVETQEFINAIQQVSLPEERAINTALESFSSDIQGEKWPESNVTQFRNFIQPGTGNSTSSPVVGPQEHDQLSSPFAT